MWFCNSSHKWSRINLLALWLHAWPCGLLWSTEQSSGDSSVQFWYEAIKKSCMILLVPLTSASLWEEHAQPAGPRRKMRDPWTRATAGSCPYQAPTSADMMWETNVCCWMLGMFCAIMQYYCGHSWLIQVGICFVFQDDFKCKVNEINK